MSSDDANPPRIHTQGKRCPGCAYPLGGVPGHRCPECGADVTRLMVDGSLRPITDAEREAAGTATLTPSAKEIRLMRPPAGAFSSTFGRLLGGALVAVFGFGIASEHLAPDASLLERVFLGGATLGMAVAGACFLTFFLQLFGVRFIRSRRVHETAVERQRALIRRDLERGVVEDIRVTATHELVADHTRLFRVYLRLSNGWVLAIREDAAPWRLGPGSDTAGRDVRLAVLPGSRVCVSLSTSGDPCRAVAGSRARPRVAPYRWATPVMFFASERGVFQIPRDDSTRPRRSVFGGTPADRDPVSRPAGVPRTGAQRG